MSARGLSDAEAKERLQRNGPNELPAGTSISAWTILIAQFNNILMLILLVAVVLSLILGHTAEAIAIAVIVLLSVVLGFMQEYRATARWKHSAEIAAPKATVLAAVRNSTFLPVNWSSAISSCCKLVTKSQPTPA